MKNCLVVMAVVACPAFAGAEEWFTGETPGWESRSEQIETNGIRRDQFVRKRPKVRNFDTFEVQATPLQKLSGRRSFGNRNSDVLVLSVSAESESLARTMLTDWMDSGVVDIQGSPKADGFHVRIPGNRKEIRVRLVGVTRPNADRDKAKQGRLFLHKQAVRKRAELFLVDTDWKDGSVAFVVVDGEDIGLRIIRNGWGQVCEEEIAFLTDECRRLYQDAQEKARAEGLGLWMQADGAVRTVERPAPSESQNAVETSDGVGPVLSEQLGTEQRKPESGVVQPQVRYWRPDRSMPANGAAQ